jgi:hypothetical protein
MTARARLTSSRPMPPDVGKRDEGFSTLIYQDRRGVQIALDGWTERPRAILNLTYQLRERSIIRSDKW